jgi:hypothetical protein
VRAAVDGLIETLADAEIAFRAWRVFRKFISGSRVRFQR